MRGQVRPVRGALLGGGRGGKPQRVASQPAQQRHPGSHPGQPQKAKPSLESHAQVAVKEIAANADDVLLVPRRSALMTVCAATAVWWLSSFPLSDSSMHDGVLQHVMASYTYEEARFACAEGAAVCTSLYSQMSSTMRVYGAGKSVDDDFQAACGRRLQSPFVFESMQAMIEAIPVVASQVAYAPETRGIGWMLAAVGAPLTDSSRAARLEALASDAVRRCRRVVRLGSAMESNRYTPAGVQVMLQDLRELSLLLEELMACATDVEQQM